MQRLSEDINRILHLAEVTAEIEALGLQVGSGKPEEFQKVVRMDAALFAEIIKDANTRLSP